MTILINFKICDNSPDCSGIKSCSKNAFCWDEVNETIMIDDKKCTSCGRCVPSCLVGAIKLARTQAEAEQIQKDMDNDPRTSRDLFVDRYGATPVSPVFVIQPHEFEKAILQSPKLAVLEIYNDDSIECLINSIPVKELFDDVIYRKMQVDDEFIQKYEISTLPALMFWDKGKVVGKIEGFYPVSEKEGLQDKIKEIISDI